MKYLSDYMQERQTVAFEQYGAFFAFSREQIEAKRQEGVKYVADGSGLICPKDNYEAFSKEIDTIYKESIQLDISENGIEAIIKRELSNHECYYTGEIDEAVEALKDYGITCEQVFHVFKGQSLNTMEEK